MKQESVVAQIDTSLLASDPSPSDRFSFARRYAPRELVGIPLYRERATQMLIDRLRDFERQLQDLRDRKALGPRGPLNRSILASTAGPAPATKNQATKMRAHSPGIDHEALAKLLKAPEIRQMTKSIQRLKTRVKASDLSEFRTLLSTPVVRKVAGLAQAMSAGAAIDRADDGFAGASEVPLDQPIYALPLLHLIDVLRSEIGYCFLDRTRIRPTSILLGEHIYTLSLAPGEEITIEQKTWSKRTVSLEQSLEDEKETQLELSSSLTTELQESLDHTIKTELQFSGSATGGLKVSIADCPIDPSLGAEARESLSIADEVARRQSLKETKTRTSKLTAKHRSLHKITFNVSTELGSESTSRRTIRNPNKTTPINLRYYKILQRQEIAQERYGLRLCWAPWIPDPGRHVRERLRAAKAKASGTPNTAPTAPTERDGKWSDWGPQLSLGPGPMGETRGFLRTDGSVSIDSNQVTTSAEPNFGDYYAKCPVPEHWAWNGKDVDFKLNFPGVRANHIEPHGTPRLQFGEVRADFHVGIDCTKSTVLGGAANAVDSSRCPISEPTYEDQTTVQMRIRLLPIRTPEEQAAFDTYSERLEEWRTTEADRIRAEAQKVLEADAGIKLAEETPDVLSEIQRRLIECLLPPETFDEYAEVDLWHHLFEWEACSYTFYPGWWNANGSPEPDRPDTDFVNASWARIFVPIRPAYEELALRWLFFGFGGGLLSNEWGQQLKKIMQEVRAYRETNFGSADELLIETATREVSEKFLTLGRWTELLPTDGTHLEIVQSATTGGDEITLGELADANSLRDATIAKRREDVQMKKKARESMTGAPGVDVSLSTDGDN